MSGLGLDTANRRPGLRTDSSRHHLRAGHEDQARQLRVSTALKRSSKGDSEGLDVEYVVQGDEYDKRKIYAFHLLDGVRAGHAKAGEITRSLLRAIYESVHAIDPNDNSPEAISRRASASLADFNGATFLAELGIERGGEKPDGCYFWPDKNIITKVLRPGDKGYRKLDQPPAAPIERSAPPVTPNPANGSPAVAPTAIAKPTWAE